MYIIIHVHVHVYVQAPIMNVGRERLKSYKFSFQHSCWATDFDYFNLFIIIITDITNI